MAEALPWAVPAAVADGALQDVAEPARGMTLEEAGLAAGGRIEVKWQVEPEDGEPFSRWWGATLVGPSSQEDPEMPGAPLFELAYDAQDGFEQERSHVCFTESHALHQVDQTEPLAWRREGEDWEEEDGESEEGAEGAEADGEAVITMDDLKQMVQNEKEALGGKTLEEAETEVLGAMEPSKRIAVAAAFRDFADNLMSFLHEKVADTAGGAPLTVTEEHVRAFMQTMNSRGPGGAAADGANKKQRTQ